MRSRPTPAAGTTLDDRPAASSVAMMPAQPKAVAPGRAATAATTTSESTTGRAPASQSFARVVPRADPKQASRDTDRLPLLDRFRIESGGNQLRIIDADGSVYEGIMLASAPTQGPPDTKGAGTLARRVEAVPTSTNSPSGQLLRYGLTARSARREEPVTSASDATSPAVDELAFEASGTNRSTSQSVRIEGRFVLNQSPDVGPAPAALSTNRSVELLQFLFQNSVVRGQAVLGNHQAIAIDAAPVGP